MQSWLAFSKRQSIGIDFLKTQVHFLYPQVTVRDLCSFARGYHLPPEHPKSTTSVSQSPHLWWLLPQELVLSVSQDQEAIAQDP
jgi:hypothetical protein